ncbi:uncharacterized protein LOC112345565 [Selaginella moellendorffii]|uniref:uncharacterized protein LOC112345565 n=1 Tax=Selaginella moellendorffii TaxID=88036 RepID=UPI000D1C91F5|nr:uncharacterized protein LOC112345565 [Selaginella moellendorffii]XP_024528381.1 uncharacterized protein LOC112345565 [Selaginella moellendorffii]|eukprot:XP_024528380.1 uncharacterized protein LOC112345565 [Selaginella moellendorffii]
MTTSAVKNKSSRDSAPVSSFQDKLAQLHTYRAASKSSPSPFSISKAKSSPESPQRSSPKAISSPSRGLLAALSSKNRVGKAESKILVTITILGSSGPLRSIADINTTVEQVVETALRAYAAQGRLPVLGSNAKLFDLYCNDGEFTALKPSQRLGALSCRHFLLHKTNQCDQDENCELEAWKMRCWCSSKHHLLRI